jgi:hypothetical protein
MYGLRLGSNILCGPEPVMSFVPMVIAKKPIIRFSAIEIDDLLQKFSVIFDEYSIVVHKFTEEEMMQFTVNRLRK